MEKAVKVEILDTPPTTPWAQAGEAGASVRSRTGWKPIPEEMRSSVAKDWHSAIAGHAQDDVSPPELKPGCKDGDSGTKNQDGVSTAKWGERKETSKLMSVASSVANEEDGKIIELVQIMVRQALRKIKPDSDLGDDACVKEQCGRDMPRHGRGAVSREGTDGSGSDAKVVQEIGGECAADMTVNQNANRIINASPQLEETGYTPLRRCNLKVGKYDGQSSLEAFMKKFELIAAANDWSAVERAGQLAGALEGDAQRVLLDVPAPALGDPQAIHTALERRFGDNTPIAAVRQQFHERFRRPRERLGVFAAELRYLAQRGFPKFPAEVVHTLTMEAFIKGLTPARLRQQVRLANPLTLEEALERALAIEEILCELPVDDSSRAAIPHPQTCAVQMTAPRRTTPVAKRQGEGTPTCWRCGQTGHIRQNCTLSDASLLTKDSGNESGPV